MFFERIRVRQTWRPSRADERAATAGTAMTGYVYQTGDRGRGLARPIECLDTHPATMASNLPPILVSRGDSSGMASFGSRTGSDVANECANVNDG